MHYYNFNIGDYHAHTSHLDPIEDIAYRRMMDWCYLHESPLPDDVEQIARLIRMRTHCDCIANVLREFFIHSDEGWYQQRIATEVKQFIAKSEKAKRSAEARWSKKPQEKQTDNANASQTHSDRNANAMLTNNHKPITKNQEPINKKQETKKKTGRFTPPTTQEVNAYAKEHNLNLTGFHDYYESNGWMVGKNKMKDWEAAARGWSKRQTGFDKLNGNSQPFTKHPSHKVFKRKKSAGTSAGKVEGLKSIQSIIGR